VPSITLMLLARRLNILHSVQPLAKAPRGAGLFLCGKRSQGGKQRPSCFRKMSRANPQDNFCIHRLRRKNRQARCVKDDTSAAVVGFNLHFTTLAKAEIMGLFKR
jgi:hypothetical protein